MDYKDEIIDHYKNPRNFGEMEDADLTINESNSSCGDVVQVQIKLKRSSVVDGRGDGLPRAARNDDVVIEEVRWRGVGCAISTAAASMLSEKVIGMTFADVEKIGEEGIVEMMGGEINAGRMKCATLAYRALLKAMKNEN
jgi:nitrogen fixation NifU-like protein